MVAVGLLTPSVRGQEVVRFDTVHTNQLGGWAIGYSVFEHDTGFHVFGLQRDLGAATQDIFFTAFDSSGGFIEEKKLPTGTQEWFGQYSPVVYDGGRYFAAVSRFVSGGLDTLFLYRYNAQGDTVWTHQLDTDTTFGVRNLTITQQKNLLVTGIHSYPEEAFVYVLDTLGNPLAYHAFLGFEPEDVEQGKDGRIYVTGRGSVTSNYSRAVLICSDTLGNELWRRIGPTYSIYYQLIATSDSSIIAMGAQGDGVAPGKAVVVKYTSGGVMEWTQEPYTTSYDDWSCYLHAGFENPDGSLIVAGWARDTIHGQAGMLFLLDSEGNTIWQRFYAHYPSNSFGDDQIFYDVKRTSDGGLVLTGETNGGDFPYAQLWLLKLDSAGCLVPGCGSVGVEEYTDLFNGKLVITPNPANERTQVTLTLPEGFATTGPLRLFLLDGQGRLVLQQPAQENLNVITGALALSGLASGTYYIHLADSKRWLAGGKLVVE